MKTYIPITVPQVQAMVWEPRSRNFLVELADLEASIPSFGMHLEVLGDVCLVLEGAGEDLHDLYVQRGEWVVYDGETLTVMSNIDFFAKYREVTP